MQELVAGESLAKVGCYGENAIQDNSNGSKAIQWTNFCLRLQHNDLMSFTWNLVPGLSLSLLTQFNLLKFRWKSFMALRMMLHSEMSLLLQKIGPALYTLGQPHKLVSQNCRQFGHVRIPYINCLTLSVIALKLHCIN